MDSWISHRLMMAKCKYNKGADSQNWPHSIIKKWNACTQRSDVKYREISLILGCSHPDMEAGPAWRELTSPFWPQGKILAKQ